MCRWGGSFVCTSLSCGSECALFIGEFLSQLMLLSELFIVHINWTEGASSQQMPRRWSSLLSRRSQATRKTPLPVRSRYRRQQVTGEWCRSGKSFQRAPPISTQRTPSKHSRDERHRRPPSGPTGGPGNRSAIRSHCVSERKGFGGRPRPCLVRPTYFLPFRQGDEDECLLSSRSLAHTPCQSCSVL